MRENPVLYAKMAEGQDFPDDINRTQTVPVKKKRPCLALMLMAV